MTALATDTRLLSEGLVDELNLLLYPVIVGTGKRLFPEQGPNFPPYPQDLHGLA